MKRNPALPHSRSNPNEVEYASIKVSKIPSDRVLSFPTAMKRNPAPPHPRSNPNEVECASIKVSNLPKRLKSTFNEMLEKQISFENRKVEFSTLYESVAKQIHSGPGDKRRRALR